jgi:twitching motility protein PilT
MSLVPSLLQAIVNLDGEALVMHVGEKPYVISPTGQVDLSARGLTVDAVSGILAQLLPPELVAALDEFGATQYEVPPMSDFSREHFTVVAARGGDDVWVEVRRRRVPDQDDVPPELLQHTKRPAAEPDPPAPTPPPPPPIPDPSSDHWQVVDEFEPESEDSAPAIRREPPRIVHAAPVAAGPTPAQSRLEPEPAPEPPAPRDDATLPQAHVLPLTRIPIRSDAPPPLGEQAFSGLDRLLRLAAARGANTVYLSSHARPSVRIDGEVQMVDGAPVLGPNEVESLLLTLMPERSAEAMRTGAATEWIVDLPDLGRVRCMSFRDHRGPGGMFRMMPVRAVTAEQLGLSREIQSLVLGQPGLALVAGPRLSGKRTLIAALVDLINRTRRDHVITIEREVNIVHERAGSFISQREARGGLDQFLEMARSALREDPDVLVLQELRSPALMNLALDAAAAGQLVIGALPAPSATDAIDRIIDLYPPESRRQIQLSLAQNLRGVVSQVLLRKTSGGRLAAREVLLNTPAVASVLAEGKTSQLPLAIEGGRKHGMVPLNDALVGFIQSGAVDVREAYRHAGDRAGFLALLERQGIDTSRLQAADTRIG